MLRFCSSSFSAADPTGDVATSLKIMQARVRHRGSDVDAFILRVDDDLVLDARQLSLSIVAAPLVATPG